MRIYKPGDEHQLLKYVRDERMFGATIAVVSGVFDVLHVGHLDLLKFAVSRADRLIVALNSDASVQRLKGCDRPIVPEEDRAEMLAAIRWVDRVVIFEGDTPADIIRIVKPDWWVKGGSYKLSDLPEASLVASLGGKIAFAPMREGYSTTAFIDRVSKLGGDDSWLPR